MSKSQKHFLSRLGPNCPVSLLSMFCKVTEKFVNNRFVNRLDKCGLCLISYMVLGLLNQLQKL